MNLKARYGQTYRIAREEGSEKGDPYGDLIPCKFGQIYLHGPATLGVFVRGGPTAKRIAALAGVKLHTDGDDGITVTFAPELFAAVAAIVRPKRRRKLSAAHRAKLAAANQAFRFASKAPEIDQKRDGMPADGRTVALAV